LRELVLKRDRFRCCACGAESRLVVHHRDGRNVKPLLTLCIRCHVRLHHSLQFAELGTGCAALALARAASWCTASIAIAFRNDRIGFWRSGGRATWEA
jgi:hypothetical protein